MPCVTFSGCLGFRKYKFSFIRNAQHSLAVKSRTELEVRKKNSGRTVDVTVSTGIYSIKVASYSLVVR
jgi:hypothetical protein